MNRTQSEYDINELYQEAQSRWLKPAEVFFILKNHEKYKLTQEAPNQPTSGSLFLFNKRVLRFFRKDGHNWRKKKDGRTVGEAHERLKVGNVEMLNCYYAHGEQNNSFQRRSYWMLDPACDHIVLVHYRNITEGISSSGSGGAQLSSGSFSSFSQSPSPSSTPQNAGSLSVSDYQSLTSPGSVEVSSDPVFQINGKDHNGSVAGTGELGGSTELEVSHALRKLEEQLSLNDDSFKKLSPPCNQVEEPNDLDLLEYKQVMLNQDQFAHFRGTENVVRDQCYSGHVGSQGGGGGDHNHFFGQEYTYERKESLSWSDVLNSCNTSSGVECQQNHLSSHRNEPDSTRNAPREELEHHQWQNCNGSSVNNASQSLCHGVDDFKFSPYPSSAEIRETNSAYYAMLFDQGQIGPLESDMNLTVAQKQKFRIQEISPEWGYATETTKIIIVGSFLCDSSESAWKCMFGDVEVPVQIIQEGVICCEAPPHRPGKVTVCITCGNRESCSEIREFEYRLRAGSSIEGDSHSTESARSPEELLLLVRFVQMLLSDSSKQKRDVIDSDILNKFKADNESWDSVIQALLFGSGTSSSTINWLLEELLKDKLQQWLSSRFQEQLYQTGCSLSKKEQGIIHMVAGLGFEWALNPLLGSGVNINFRDITGWTALHWAARSGREKMVAALMASGASAGAVTDPTSQNPTGLTAATIAATHGHKGLAGYLSEMALTSHLSSLTLEESELSKGSAELEAEETVNCISKQNLIAYEHQHSLKHTLAAVRNAAQAAARIQSAFRAHSFRKRQQLEADVFVDEYGMNSADIQKLSAMSKLNFGNPRDYNSAALSIQKKYRGWKGHKDFLAFRQKVVNLQACVRGYQVRKHHKEICRAVGVLEKAVLRWRRKGAGLRGFRPETDPIEESEDEDILKVFRKEKVDGAINQAISRVLSMVKSPKARQQYHRVHEKYCQAKAERGGTSDEAEESTDLADFNGVEDINMYQFPYQ